MAARTRVASIVRTGQTFSCMKMNVDVFMCDTKKCEHFSYFVPGEICNLSLRFQVARGNMLCTGIK